MDTDGCPVTGRGRTPASTSLRAEIAAITAATRARLDELVIPDGASRTRKAEIRETRRKVWADRTTAIEAATQAHRTQQAAAKAERRTANAAAHRAATAARRTQRRSDYTARGMERADQAAQEEQTDAVRRDEAALYRGEGTTR